MLLDGSPRLSSCALPRSLAGGHGSHGHLLDSPKSPAYHHLPLLSAPSSNSHSRRGSFQEPRTTPSRPGSSHNNGGASTFASSSALVLDSDGNVHDPGYLNGLMELHAAIGNAATSQSSHRRRSSAMKPRRASWLGGSALVTDDDIEYSSSDDDDEEAPKDGRRYGAASPSYMHGSGRSTVRPSLEMQASSSARPSVDNHGSPLLGPPSSSKSHRLSWSSGVSEERKAGSGSRRSSAAGNKPQIVAPLDDWSVGGFTGIVDIEKARRESTEQSRHQQASTLLTTPRSMEMSKSRSNRSRSARSSPNGSVDDATAAALREEQDAADEEAAVMALPHGSPLRQALAMSGSTKRRPSEASTSTTNSLRQPTKRTVRSASDAAYNDANLSLFPAPRPAPRTYQTQAVPRLSTIRSGAPQPGPYPSEARFSDLANYTTSEGLSTSEAVEAERRRRAADEARVARAPRLDGFAGRTTTTSSPSVWEDGSSAAQACAHSIKRGFQSFALGVRFKARFARRRLDGTL